jgi:hypothetical protein
LREALLGLVAHRTVVGLGAAFRTEAAARIGVVGDRQGFVDIAEVDRNPAAEAHMRAEEDTEVDLGVDRSNLGLFGRVPRVRLDWEKDLWLQELELAHLDCTSSVK